MGFEDPTFAPVQHSIEELEQLYPTVDSLQQRLEEIFGERERLYLDERYKRIRLFETGVADLFDALRREPTPADLEVPFARVVSRIMCIASSIDGVLVSEGLMLKYPLGGCAYCHAQPCGCTAFRGEPTLGTNFDSEQRDWGLLDWQRYLNQVYGSANSARGIWYVTTRLAVETNELLAEEDKVSNSLPADVRYNYALEVADTMAWTMAAASLLGVDVQSATLARFGNGCQVCAGIPCGCPRPNFQQVKFD